MSDQPNTSMPSVLDRLAIHKWLFGLKDDAEALAKAIADLAKQHLYVNMAALRTGESDPDKLLTRLPLFNGHAAVLEPEHATIGGLPSAAADEAVFIGLHKDHVHLHCGEEHRGIPIQAYVDWLVAHKDDDAALDPVVLLFHNRNITVNKPALKEGETDPARLFKVGPDAHLKRDGDDALIVPLDQIAVARIYGHHHDMKHGPKEPKMPVGGAHSVKAIAALDHFLETVMGIKTNHGVIKQRFGKPQNATKGDPS